MAIELRRQPNVDLSTAYQYPISNDNKKLIEENQSDDHRNHYTSRVSVDVANSRKQLSVKNIDQYQDNQDPKLVTEVGTKGLKRKLAAKATQAEKKPCESSGRNKAAMWSKIREDEGFLISELGSTKRRLHDLYQAEDNKRKLKLIKVLDPKDLPNQVSSRNRRGYKIRY